MLNDEPVTPDAIAVLIPVTDLEAFIEKLTRGLTYIQTGKTLAPDYRIQQWIYPDGVEPELFTRPLDRWGVLEDYSPAIKARSCRAADDEMACILELTIWEQLSVYVAVQAPDPGTGTTSDQAPPEGGGR